MMHVLCSFNVMELLESKNGKCSQCVMYPWAHLSMSSDACIRKCSSLHLRPNGTGVLISFFMIPWIIASSFICKGYKCDQEGCLFSKNVVKREISPHGCLDNSTQLIYLEEWRVLESV